MEEPSLFSLKQAVNPAWKHELTAEARSYLEKRRISDAPFYREPMWSCRGAKNGIDYILIPWKVNGVEAYWQLNDFKKSGNLKYVFPRGQKKLVYGLD